MNRGALLVAGAAVAAAIGAAYVLRRSSSAPAAAPATSVGVVEPSGKVKAAAQAIARAEGFYVAGSIPQRANNPGNLKLGGAQTINGITVFTTAGEGWAALYRQLNLIVQGRSSFYSLNMSIREMGQRWTATAHEQLAWARNVAGTIGVSVDATLRSVLA